MIVWAHVPCGDVRKTHICCEHSHTNPTRTPNPQTQRPEKQPASGKHNLQRECVSSPWPSRPPLAPCPHKYRRHLEKNATQMARMQPRCQRYCGGSHASSSRAGGSDSVLVYHTPQRHQAMAPSTNCVPQLPVSRRSARLTGATLRQTEASHRVSQDAIVVCCAKPGLVIQVGPSF